MVGVEVGVLYIKRSVSSVTKKHEGERSTKKERYSVTMHMEKNRSNLGDGSEFGKFAKNRSR